MLGVNSISGRTTKQNAHFQNENGWRSKFPFDSPQTPEQVLGRLTPTMKKSDQRSISRPRTRAKDSRRPPSPPASRNRQSSPHIVVVGAGAFGGWTALHLRRSGAQVTLLDAWGPGHVRSSSGGETRVIRATYGPDRPYYGLVKRSLELWRENEKQWKRPLYQQTGLLWMAGKNDAYEQATLPLLREHGLAYESLTPDEASKRYPHICFDGVPWVIQEIDAGYLLARRACAAVMESFVAEGGRYQQFRAVPDRIIGGALKGLRLQDGTWIQADAYVFACGPWLGQLFPGVVQIRSTRQEVYYFGTPAGDRVHQEENTPAWIDHGPGLIYGIPGNEWRGFKLADDAPGKRVDPESQDRSPTPSGIAAVRKYLHRRFPKLKGAPLIGAEVCQYEVSADKRYIADRHPEASNVWLVGGGSGHGFKNGPAFGEYVARIVLSKQSVDPFFGLSRFGSDPSKKAKPERGAL